MTTLEKEEVKGIVREMMHEDKEFFKTILREVLLEGTTDGEAARKAKIDAIIQRDFQRYENVFKALA